MIKLYAAIKHIVIIYLLIFASGCNNNELTAQDIHIANKSERIQQIESVIKSQRIGAIGWRIVYSGNNSIVNNGGGYLISYKNKQGSLQVDNALNLKNIDAHYVQGDINTVFSFSNDGSLVVINNRDSNIEKKHNVYCFDMRNNTLKLISKVNHINAKDAWSPESNYYAIADINNIIVYNTRSHKITVIPFNNGQTRKIFVSENGDLLLDSKEKYLLTGKSGYKPKKIDIEGELLFFNNGNIVYFYNEGIYSGQSDGAFKKIMTTDPSFDLCFVDNKRAIFSNNNKTLVYVFDTKETQYFNFGYNNCLSDQPKFSLDSKRCLLRDQGVLKVVSSDNTTQLINENDSYIFDGDYSWLDERTLVKIVNKSYILGDYSFIKKTVN